MESIELIRIASAALSDKISDEDKEKAKQFVLWQEETLKVAKAENIPLNAAVLKLKNYLLDLLSDVDNSMARMYASQMLTELPKKWIVFHSIEDWLTCINYSITRAPVFTPIKEKQMFFPLSKLFVFYMFTPSGNVLFRDNEFNRRVTSALTEWCKYLDSSDSKKVLNPSLKIPAIDGWLCEAAQQEFCLEQSTNFKKRDDDLFWGFKSFNSFFHREMDLETYRPMDTCEDENSVDVSIVSANDGSVYRIERNIGLSGKFWAKGQEYSLFDMLGGGKDLAGACTPRELIDFFIGGDVMQSFLSGSDYHRWHSPISGTVSYSRRIEGMTFSSLLRVGFDRGAGVKSQGYGTMVNTRGLVILDSPVLGKVAVIPIGITEISSVNITVKEGQILRKGEEMGYFSYGGSSLALVFQPGMIKTFVARVQEEPQRSSAKNSCKTSATCKAEKGCLMVRSTIAIANSKM